MIFPHSVYVSWPIIYRWQFILKKNKRNKNKWFYVNNNMAWTLRCRFRSHWNYWVRILDPSMRHVTKIFLEHSIAERPRGWLCEPKRLYQSFCHFNNILTIRLAYKLVLVNLDLDLYCCRLLSVNGLSDSKTRLLRQKI